MMETSIKMNKDVSEILEAYKFAWAKVPIVDNVRVTKPEKKHG